ncbi:hypothetical protein HMPREF0326_05647 [Desulfovibrio sp. 3_1_syn3]|uniref:hypothetical protein n=1 Tax=Desulfovibrio sp. 3_1_syn3 TaxID=457398 RepID=UPI0002F5C210|nr:hypothetical protein [Desulfovibrio sp. 3_1_syn3]EQN50790.1 hypothetical protein HMPREF0326_05647 [Desulfovibrio sp. 3_1_syn3]
MPYDYYVLYEHGDEKSFRSFPTWPQAESFAARMSDNGYYTITTRQCAPALEPVTEDESRTAEDENEGIFCPATMTPPAREAA